MDDHNNGKAKQLADEEAAAHESGSYSESAEEEDFDAMTVEQLQAEVARTREQIAKLELDLGVDEKRDEDEEDDFEFEFREIPEHCVPLRADVRSFDWKQLAKEVQFDCIMMDPPWQLAGAMPTRGVALSYQQLPNRDIEDIPIPSLQQKGGFLFIWVINKTYGFALELFEHWGYDLIDDITWVKHTNNRRMAKGHGFYLQHAKETCLVGKKRGGQLDRQVRGGIGSDLIYSERRGQSQKPEELYELVEQLFPNGYYLEIFARRNNLRNYWVSIGNEL